MRKSDWICGQRTAAVVALLAMGVVSGCAVDSTRSKQNSQISWLSPAATIRVEVEVYKGPLSNELAVQAAELEGIVIDSKRAMEILFDNMKYSGFRLNCFKPKQERKNCESRNYSGTITDTICFPHINDSVAFNIMVPDDNDISVLSLKARDKAQARRDKTQACNSLRQLFHDIKKGMEKQVDMEKLFKKCSFGKPHDNNNGLKWCENELGQISTYGSYLKRRAAYWAAEHVATSPRSTRLRIEMANFMQFAAEYGNQITSRADALLKQAAGAGPGAVLMEQLSNSTYLRDSEPTAYLNLYDWNNAAVEEGRETTAAERIRMVEHLVADNYWSHINTVFAAGQGNVSMALVKDDVGNWNLKSFDNSPGELLDAYKELGRAAVGKAVELVRGGGNFSEVKNALNFADQAALGSTSGGRAAETQDRLAAMRQETAHRIMQVVRDHKKHEEELNKEHDQLESGKEKEKVAVQISDLRSDTIVRIRKLLEQHSAALIEWR